MSISLAQAKQRLAAYAPSDILVDRINSAVELLLGESNSSLSKARVAIEVSNGKLTLPREYSAVVGIAVDSYPAQIRGRWYETLLGGVGVQEDGVYEPTDFGEGWVSFVDIEDINEAGVQIEVRSSIAEDADTTIVLMGLDQNGNEVTTDHDADGALELGEEVDVLVSGYDVSSTTFTKLTGVIKGQTNGVVTLYAVDGSEKTLIARYAPDEINPSYRRYLIPESSDGSDRTVVALAQRRATYVTDDSAILPVPSMTALRYALLCLQAEDNADVERAEQYRAKALREMNNEFRKNNPVSVQPPPIQWWGTGPRSFY